MPRYDPDRPWHTDEHHDSSTWRPRVRTLSRLQICPVGSRSWPWSISRGKVHDYSTNTGSQIDNKIWNLMYVDQPFSLHHFGRQLVKNVVYPTNFMASKLLLLAFNSSPGWRTHDGEFMWSMIRISALSFRKSITRKTNLFHTWTRGTKEFGHQWPDFGGTNWFGIHDALASSWMRRLPSGSVSLMYSLSYWKPAFCLKNQLNNAVGWPQFVHQPAGQLTS